MACLFLISFCELDYTLSTSIGYLDAARYFQLCGAAGTAAGTGI